MYKELWKLNNETNELLETDKGPEQRRHTDGQSVKLPHVPGRQGDEAQTAVTPLYPSESGHGLARTGAPGAPGHGCGESRWCRHLGRRFGGFSQDETCSSHPTRRSHSLRSPTADGNTRPHRNPHTRAAAAPCVTANPWKPPRDPPAGGRTRELSLQPWEGVQHEEDMSHPAMRGCGGP